jgi:maleate cis-trans isomerase
MISQPQQGTFEATEIKTNTGIETIKDILTGRNIILFPHTSLNTMTQVAFFSDNGVHISRSLCLELLAIFPIILLKLSSPFKIEIIIFSRYTALI